MTDYRHIIDKALKYGADEVELFIDDWRETRVVVNGDKVGAASVADVSGVGVRVFCDKRLGFAYTNDTDMDGLERAVREAIDMANAAEPDEYNRLPSPQPVTVGDRFYDQRMVELGLATKIDMLLPLENEAKRVSPKVRGITEAMYTDQVACSRVINSHGIDLCKRSTSAGVVVEVVSEDGGETESAYRMQIDRSIDGLDYSQLVRDTAEEAVQLLRARQVDSCHAPVILAPQVASQFLSVLGIVASAEMVQKKRSFLMGKLNTKVGSDDLTILDDPELPGGDRSQPFDGEGVPCRTMPIIDHGVLTNFLYDTITAARDGRESNGRGNRLGYRSVPQASGSNIAIRPSGRSREDLLRMGGRGLYVVQVFGLSIGGADTVSGNMSVGATGFWFEDGELKFPVREVTIAGNLLTLLGRVVANGEEPALIAHRGCFSSPALLISEMSIAGK